MFDDRKNQFSVYLFIILIGVIMSSVYATQPNITLIADPMVLKIPIRDNHEVL